MEEIIEQLLRESEFRRYGKYRGKVVDNRDPDKLGRLRLKIPSVLNNQTSDWALPCLPFGGKSKQGMFFIPEIDSRVWVEFEEGNVNRPIWTGVYWEKSADLPENAAKEEPSTRTIQTPCGHQLQFDDADQSERIQLNHTSGAELIMDQEGSVILANGRGMTIKFDENKSEVYLEDGKGNSLRLNDNGWQMEDNSGTRLEMHNGSSTVTANTKITLNAPSVSLGGQGGEPILKGMSFLTKYMTHTHTVAPIVGGPTSPPIPQGEMDALSTKVVTG